MEFKALSLTWKNNEDTDSSDTTEVPTRKNPGKN